MVAVSVSPSSGSVSFLRTSNVTALPSLVLAESATATGGSLTSSMVMSNGGRGGGVEFVHHRHRDAVAVLVLVIEYGADDPDLP